jgi:hypothetical protein
MSKPATPYTCPDCGRVFARKPMEHACAVYDLSRHLDGKPEHIVAICEKILDHARGLGATIEPMKTMILLRTTKNFAGLLVQKSAVKLSLLLGSEPDTPLLARRGPGYGKRVDCQFVLTDSKQVDRKMLGWLTEAWELAQ